MSVTPSAPSTDSDVARWDPCDLSDADIADAGLDVASKKTDVAGVGFEGWRVCGWRDSGNVFDFVVMSSAHTLDEVRQRDDYVDFTESTVGGHPALQYRPAAAATNALVCYVSVAVPSGMVDFKVQNRYGVPGADADPCVDARRLSGMFADELPQS